MKSLRLCLVAAAWLCLPHAVFASPINVVSYVSLSGLVTFEDVAGGSGIGTPYNGVLTSGGQQFAERFVGQTLTQVTQVTGADTDVFDVLSGSPSGPLALQVGAPDQNLAVFDDFVFLTPTLAGIGPQGFNFDGVGNGSIAMLFVADQSQLGFQVLAGEGGSATVDFFRRNGTLIERIVLVGLTDGGLYGFSLDSGDIAGFSVFNNDVNGISFDNVTFGTPVPEPGTLTLVCVAGLFLRRRLKRSS